MNQTKAKIYQVSDSPEYRKLSSYGSKQRSLVRSNRRSAILERVDFHIVDLFEEDKDNSTLADRIEKVKQIMYDISLQYDHDANDTVTTISLNNDDCLSVSTVAPDADSLSCSKRIDITGLIESYTASKNNAESKSVSISSDGVQAFWVWKSGQVVDETEEMWDQIEPMDVEY